MTIVTVWPSCRSERWAMRGQPELRQVVEDKGQELLRNIAGEYAGSTYQIATALLHGDPAFAILDAAARHQAQIIVIGSRGVKAIERFLRGSVSEKVLVHARCSVLIVR